MDRTPNGFFETKSLRAWRRLARSFPIIEEHAEEEDCADPEAIATWAMETGNSAARHVAAFLCATWNNRRQWSVGAFDLFAALGTWDSRQRAAFLAWVADPRTF